MSSPLRVDVRKYRENAVRAAEEQFKAARTTTQKHEARLAVQKARRAADG